MVRSQRPNTPVINLMNLETPSPSADYVIYERPHRKIYNKHVEFEQI